MTFRLFGFYGLMISVVLAATVEVKADWALAVGQNGSKQWAYGSSWSKDVTGLARKKALASCDKHDSNCKIVLDGVGGCVALAVGNDDNAYYAQQAPTRIEAAESAFGGNMDNKELTAGTTLFLPMFTEGTLFSCGDGHGVQGDGEVCITAIETALRGTFEFIVRDDMSLATPRAETPTHFITMGFDPSLDECARIALRDMIALIGEVAGLSL